MIIRNCLALLKQLGHLEQEIERMTKYHQNEFGEDFRKSRLQELVSEQLQKGNHDFAVAQANKKGRNS